MQFAHIVCELGIAATCKRLDVLALCSRFVVCQVVVAEDDVLVDVEHWATVGRFQEVIHRAHQFAGFGLRIIREWQVNRHLVTVVVGVETARDEWMQLDRFAFDEHRLEGLDTESVK